MNGGGVNKFRNRIIEVEAMLYDGSNARDVIRWLGKELCMNPCIERSASLLIITPEGTRRAEEGDWIIKGFYGEVYPYKPDLFESKFEAV